MESKSGNKTLTLCVIAPDGRETKVECDSVKLSAIDGEKKRGGGYLGIRKGHIDAIVSLDNKPICAYLDGDIVYKQNNSGGVAVIKSNSVTVFQL